MLLPALDPAHHLQGGLAISNPADTAEPHPFGAKGLEHQGQIIERLLPGCEVEAGGAPAPVDGTTAGEEAQP